MDLDGPVGNMCWIQEVERSDVRHPAGAMPGAMQ